MITTFTVSIFIIDFHFFLLIKFMVPPSPDKKYETKKAQN